MRHSLLKEAQAALANALDHLEDVRMTRSNDPALSELKADIRRTITQRDPETELATAG
jgi:hypothetical protein